MFKNFVAVAIIAGAAILSVPIAANAAGYVPDGNVVVSDPTPAPGDSVTITFTDGSFLPGEPVTGSASGEPTPTIAVIFAGTASITKNASATGSVTFTITASAAGTYGITAVGGTSGNVGTASITVAPADAAGGGSTGDSATGGLPNTGGEFPVLAVWIGGGALALGVALVLALTISRRRNETA